MFSYDTLSVLQMTQIHRPYSGSNTNITGGIRPRIIIPIRVRLQVNLQAQLQTTTTNTTTNTGK